MSAELSERRWLNIRELASRLGIGVSTIYRYLADPENDFPKPQKWGGRRGHLRWKVSDIEEWEGG